MTINAFIAVAVFLNAIAPLSIAVNQSANANETALEQLLGDKILICTPFGFKYVSLDELSKSQRGDGDASLTHCPLCQISTHVNALYIVDLTTLFEIEIKTADNQFYTTLQSQKTKTNHNDANPRAPPTFI